MALQLRSPVVGKRQIVAPQPTYGTTLLQALSNRRYSARFTADTDLLAVGIAWEVTTFATGDDPCSVGLLSIDGQTLLASAPATQGKMNATNGVKTLESTTPYQIVPGTDYWAALSYGTPVGTVATLRMNSAGGLGDLFGATMLKATQMISSVALSHPVAAPSTYGTASAVPIMAVYEA